MKNDGQIASLRKAVAEYHILVGNVVQALEGYDIDDGANTLVLSGVVAELKRLEDAYSHLWRQRSRKRS